MGFEPLKCASVLLNRQGLKCPVLSDQLEKSFYQKGVFLFQKPLRFEPLKCASVPLNYYGFKTPILFDN